MAIHSNSESRINKIFAPMVAAMAWHFSILWGIVSLPALAASFGASYWLAGLNRVVISD